MKPIRIISTQDRDILQVRFWPTDICNFNCSYCFPGSHDNKFRYPKNFDFILEKFRSIFDEYLSKGKTKFHLTISGGGEPTLWPRLEDFCRQIKESHDVFITLVSNGSRTLEWWKNNYRYFDDVVLSFHIAESKIDHHCDVADFLYEKKLKVTSLILMDYQRWNDCVSTIDQMMTSKWPWVIQTKEIVDAPGHGIESYSNEQKDYLKNSIKRIPSSDRLLENLDDHKLHQSVAIFDDNSAQCCRPHTLILNNWNNFKGWKCNLGNESIIITVDGQILGSCGIKFLDDGTVICPKNICSCQPDTHISKFS